MFIAWNAKKWEWELKKEQWEKITEEEAQKEANLVKKFEDLQLSFNQAKLEKNTAEALERVLVQAEELKQEKENYWVEDGEVFSASKLDALIWEIKDEILKLNPLGII